MSVRRVSVGEHLETTKRTEAAFKNILKGLGSADYVDLMHPVSDDLMTLSKAHPALRERVLCTISYARHADVVDVCLRPAEVLKEHAGQSTVLALRVLVEMYLDHWRLRESIMYKRRPGRDPWPQTFDVWSQTMMDDGRDGVLLVDE